MQQQKVGNPNIFSPILFKEVDKGTFLLHVLHHPEPFSATMIDNKYMLLIALQCEWNVTAKVFQFHILPFISSSDMGSLTTSGK